MDPNACFRRMLAAATDDDRDEYIAACYDLADWLRAGGFKPDRAILRAIPGTRTDWSVLDPVPGSMFDRWTLVHWNADGSVRERFSLEA